MPALDFPPNTAHPAVPVMGDKWPQPPVPNQPVYTWDGVKWTTHGEAVDDVIGASNLIPLADGVASAGVEANWSRGDHVHPATIADLVLTGNPTAPTPPLGDDDTSIATTAFVQATVTATEIGTSVLVGSNAPVGAADNSLWFEDDTGRLYIFYNDGTGPSQWIAAAPVPDAITSRYGIYAAPFDAMAYSGMQINGGAEVGQERTAGTVVPGSGIYACDGWKQLFAGTMGINGGQVAIGGPPDGFSYHVRINTATAQASLGATDFVTVSNIIEGYRAARLAWGTASAQPIVISFWSSHQRPGLYSVSVRNAAATRNYVSTYTQITGGTAQYNTVTVPGDTTGTWDKANLIGLEIVFAIACGATYTAPAANVWNTTLYRAAPGQVNGVGAISDVFRITGLTVLPGTQYPEAAQSALVMRPYDQELVTCKRYFQKFTGIIVDTSAASHSTVFPVEMRIAPAVTGGGAGFSASNSNTVSAQFSQTTRAAQTLVLDARL